MTHEFINYVADRTASREVDALYDYFSLGTVIRSGELTYDAARDQLVAAFESRSMKAGTAKTYLSQGFQLAIAFRTFSALEEWADLEHDGSRSMKRLYDATRVKSEPAVEEPAVEESAVEEPAVDDMATDAVRRDAILAILASMTDAADIATVRDAAAEMLKVAAAA